MALTQQHLDRLVEAWATGTRSVTIDGRTTQFDTLAKLELRIAAVARALGVPNPIGISGERKRTRRIYTVTSAGFE